MKFVAGLLFLLAPLVDGFQTFPNSPTQQQAFQSSYQPLRQRNNGARSSTSLAFWGRKKNSVQTVEKPETKATIQILMSDTGGGHRASANALRDALDVLYPNRIQCDIVDIYTEYGPFFPYNYYPQGYKLMAKYPITWDLFFRFGCTEFGMWLNDFLLTNACFEPFVECLGRPSGDTNQRADMVVSVHPLTQDLPMKILAHLDSKGATRDPEARTTPFCTVVTDLGSAHPTWFSSHVDKCFVPSDALREQALGRGLKPSQIVQHGLPIRQGFWNTNEGPSAASSKQELRQRLNLDTELPTVLVVGGGDGMGGVVDIAMALAKEQGQDSQLVVVCGNNKAAKEQLESQSFDGPVSVQGFVDNMDEFIRASDVLVTKAGPGTIAEASICGLPCMMFAFLPGQEEGNIPFVENAGFGKYSGQPSEIAKVVNSWISDPEMLASMKDCALEAARPQATLDIAKDIGEMLFEHKKQQEQPDTAATTTTAQELAVLGR